MWCQSAAAALCMWLVKEGVIWGSGHSRISTQLVFSIVQVCQWCLEIFTCSTAACWTLKCACEEGEGGVLLSLMRQRMREKNQPSDKRQAFRKLGNCAPAFSIYYGGACLALTCNIWGSPVKHCDKDNSRLLSVARLPICVASSVMTPKAACPSSEDHLTSLGLGKIMWDSHLQRQDFSNILSHLGQTWTGEQSRCTTVLTALLFNFSQVFYLVIFVYVLGL